MKLQFTLVSVFVLTAILASAQQSSSNPQPAANAQQSSPGAQQKTITGCLSGYGDRYTIGTSKDNIYLLEGDPAVFKKLNGARVEVTGTLSPAKKGRSGQDALDYQFPTIKVTSLKKLDGTCGL